MRTDFNVKDETLFLGYVVEMYKAEKRMTGRDAYNYLRRTGATDFVRRCYGGLHTTGNLYIIDSIDEYIANRKAEQTLS
jgi:hypothetical protein